MMARTESRVACRMSAPSAGLPAASALALTLVSITFSTMPQSPSSAETRSPLGARLLNDWNREVELFWQVVPKEMLSRLPVPLATTDAKRA